MSPDFASVDYFSEASLVEDPYPWFDWVRSRGPVVHDPSGRNVVIVVGYDEAVEVMRDNDAYSRCNTVGGPLPELPVEPQGDDISALIEEYRHIYPLSDHVVTFDPPKHRQHRHLLSKLLTPKGLEQSEGFLAELADREIDAFFEQGRCEFVHAYAEPYATLTIANILGVPERDHAKFRDAFDTPFLGNIDGSEYSGGHVTRLEKWFAEYLEDRRRQPTDDTLTKIAQATFPDGLTPDLVDVVAVSTFLFAAGRGTTVHLLAAAVQFLAESPELQKLLRENRNRVPDYVEEVLRLESPIKANFRMTRKTTRLAGVELKAGTTVMLLLGACNRDPRHFESPNALDIDRGNAREHIAFGRGIGACPGGPLARAEARVTLNRVLDRMADIRISEPRHGPPGARHYRYDPTYFLRRISELHLEFEPIG